MITKQEALDTAKSALETKSVPFREGTANVRMSPKAHSPSPTWLVSFDIPMPLNMQDEYFTVVINGETGLVINILTPTGMLEQLARLYWPRSLFIKSPLRNGLSAIRYGLVLEQLAQSMESILPVDNQMAGFDDEKLLKLLSHPSGPIRARAIPTLGIRIGKSIHLKEALFAAAADPDNLALKFYAFIKVAWVAAITILDNGRNDDFLRLKKVVTQWPENEQSGFNSCIKGYRNFDKLV